MKTSIQLIALAIGVLLLAVQSSLAQPAFILDPAFHPTITGSQSLHAHTEMVPVEVLISKECDLWAKGQFEKLTAVEEALGQRSPYFTEHGVEGLRLRKRPGYSPRTASKARVVGFYHVI